MLKFAVSQPYDKPEQPKLLPGRVPIIQVAKKPTQSKTSLKVSILESAIIPESSGNHDKVNPVSNYTIPQTMSEYDSFSRTIKRKGIQDLRREITAYADPFYRPPPKLTEISKQVTQKKILQ